MKKQVKDAKKRGANPASIDPDKNMRPMTAVTKSLSQAKELDADLDPELPAEGPLQATPVPLHPRRKPSAERLRSAWRETYPACLTAPSGLPPRSIASSGTASSSIGC